MTFNETVSTLPSIDHIDVLLLTDSNGNSETIANRPGKAGSVAVYNALFLEFGKIDINAAQKGLQLFAEHTVSAQQNPGAHPNIDRLFAVIASGLAWEIQIVPN